jgi:hypothetical protein
VLFTTTASSLTSIAVRNQFLDRQYRQGLCSVTLFVSAHTTFALVCAVIDLLIFGMTLIVLLDSVGAHRKGSPQKRTTAVLFVRVCISSSLKAKRTDHLLKFVDEGELNYFKC